MCLAVQFYKALRSIFTNCLVPVIQLHTKHLLPSIHSSSNTIHSFPPSIHSPSTDVIPCPALHQIGCDPAVIPCLAVQTTPNRLWSLLALRSSCDPLPCTTPKPLWFFALYYIKSAVIPCLAVQTTPNRLWSLALRSNCDPLPCSKVGIPCPAVQLWFLALLYSCDPLPCGTVVIPCPEVQFTPNGTAYTTSGSTLKKEAGSKLRSD